MRTLIALLVFLSLGVSAANAVSHCEASLKKLSHRESYLKLGVDLDATRPKVKALFEKSSAALLSPKAPSFEELEKLDLKSWNIPKQLSPTDPLANPKNLDPLLKLFTHVEEDAEYLFVGNGYYIPYLMAQSAFAGTPMQDRIKFVAFSRELAKKASETPELFHDYFKSLGLGNGNSLRKMVVIDSISSSESASGHSVIRTSNVLRNYLVNQGVPKDEAIRAVITLGMPEGDPAHSYRTRTLDEYYRKLSQVQAKDLRTAPFPYFDPGIDFGQSPFLHSYDYVGTGHYWNGKYNSLDKLGIPRGTEDIRRGLDKLPLQDLEDFLWERANKAQYYQELIFTHKKNAERHTQEISNILKSHHLK